MDLHDLAREKLWNFIVLQKKKMQSVAIILFANGCKVHVLNEAVILIFLLTLAPKIHIQIPPDHLRRCHVTIPLCLSQVGYFKGTLQLLWQELLKVPFAVASHKYLVRGTFPYVLQKIIDQYLFFLKDKILLPTSGLCIGLINWLYCVTISALGSKSHKTICDVAHQTNKQTQKKGVGLCRWSRFWVFIWCSFFLSFKMTWWYYLSKMIRDGFKTQPPVDRRFRPVPPGFYCSKQWQPPGNGRNRRLTGGWVLKPPLRHWNFTVEKGSKILIIFFILKVFFYI